MMRSVGLSIVAAGVAACAAMVPAMSHDHATGVIKERMDLMESIGKRMKAINARIKNRQELAKVKDDARAMATSAGHIALLFPPGSTQHPTEAKTTIWQDFPDFERKAKALEEESAKLAQANANDFPALAAQVRAVSRTCGNCHEPYRVRR